MKKLILISLIFSSLSLSSQVRLTNNYHETVVFCIGREVNAYSTISGLIETKITVSGWYAIKPYETVNFTSPSQHYYYLFAKSVDGKMKWSAATFLRISEDAFVIEDGQAGSSYHDKEGFFRISIDDNTSFTFSSRSDNAVPIISTNDATNLAIGLFELLFSDKSGSSSNSNGHWETCSNCDGKGWVGLNFKDGDCWVCDGSREVWIDY